MNDSPWHDLPTVRTSEELTDFGVPHPMVRDKVVATFEESHVDWLAHAKLAFIGTVGADGSMDVSPKGDPSGLITVLDERTIVIPERPGNRRMDGFHNIVETGAVGILAVIPGRNDTLRINGTGQIVTDGPFFDDLTIKGHRPKLALIVHVREIFFHCPKAFLRSAAWTPDTDDAEAVASYAELAKKLWRREDDPAEVDRHYADAQYLKTLYAE